MKLHTNHIFPGLEAKHMQRCTMEAMPETAKVLNTISLLSPREPDGKLKSASKVAPRF